MSNLIVAKPERRGDEIQWLGRLESENAEPLEIYFQFEVPNDGEFVPTARTFVFAFLLPAMKLGEPLKIGGVLDEITRRNLYEWQRAYADADSSLKVVELIEEGELVKLPQRSGAICAFSGGVDSCFTALRRPESELGPTPNVRGALMVHGFDIKLQNAEGFSQAFARSKNLLEGSGVRLFQLRTNAREVLGGLRFLWGPYSHGIILAAVLSCYESFFRDVVIPSTFNYKLMKFPWGSGPATDHLFSSRETDWWHDGATYNKLGKVVALAEVESVCRYLRVCWAGKEVDRNCGHCFKCVATQVCFWIAGNPSPECFHSPCTMREVAWTPLRNSNNLKLFGVFEKAAEEKGMTKLANACRGAQRRQGLIKIHREVMRPFRRRK
jgi:hypothetical protein